MAEETPKLAAKTNLLDPKVVFDPTKATTTVPKYWITNTEDDDENAAGNVNVKPNADMTKSDGIIFPLVKIDSQVVPAQYIKRCKLSYKDFIPELSLIIREYPELMLSTTGMVNKVTIVMVPPVDGTYKKISVDFYIVSKSEYNGEIFFTCDYFFPELQKKFTKSIKNESGVSKINTYDLLSAIAKECKLGFAATDKCKDIADTKLRLSRNQSYLDVIKEHIKFGGLDDNSFFDAWIDVYGYLVLANLSCIFSSKVQTNELSMKQLVGVPLGDASQKAESVKFTTEDVVRMFSNFKMTGKKVSNKILDYVWQVNNDLIKRNGTDNKYFYLNHLVNGEGSNNIETEVITIEEDSADGKNYKDAYTFQKNLYIGTEMGSISDGNTPVLIQEKRRNAFIAKKKSKILKVELTELNTFIERGTLINIMIYEYNRTKKQQLMLNTGNLAKDGNLDTTPNQKVVEDEADTTNTNTVLSDDSFGLPNLEYCGIYYVDGIEYLYEGGEVIKQTLYLIKHTGTTNSFLNYSSIPKIKEIND